MRKSQVQILPLTILYPSTFYQRAVEKLGWLTTAPDIIFYFFKFCLREMWIYLNTIFIDCVSKYRTIHFNDFNQSITVRTTIKCIHTIMEFYLSDKPSKRFLAVVEGKKIYFGQPDAYTYLDGASAKVRENYRARHLANKNEKYKIENLIPSPALFSYYITWGDSRNIHTNIKNLNKIYS